MRVREYASIINACECLIDLTPLKREKRSPCQTDNDNREKINGVEGFRVFVWTMGFS